MVAQRTIGAPSRAEGRRLFADRLSELFAAAGGPPLKTVVRAANARLPEGTSQITFQRISDWRRGSRTPATFDSVRPVLEVLIADARRRNPDNPRADRSLLDLAQWRQDWAATRVEPPTIDADRAPYLGLRPYGVEDSDLFFGRTDAKQQLLELISAAESSDEAAAALLLGPSGIGKSSLLAAGLHAAPGPRTPIAMTPGQDPVAALAAALAGPPPTHRLLLIDQGEQVFTLCSDDALRREFLRELTILADPAADPPTTVVVAFDIAYLQELLRYPRMADPLRQRAMLLDPMTPQELREAIVRPAETTGLRVEDSLVEVMLQDLDAIDAHSSARLPLLSLALSMTWAKRHGRTLTVDGYREAGGLSGACAVGCEAVWSQLSDGEREIARHVLLALTIIEPTTVVRNRVPVELLIEESADPASARAVIARMATARILLRHNNDVELVHDLLLTGWPRLAEWLAEEREFAADRQRIEADAREWTRLERPTTLLYTKSRLENAAGWMRRTESSNRLAREFVSASLARQRTRIIRWRIFLSAVAVLTVLALVLSVVVVGQRATVAQEGKDALLSQFVDQSERVENADPVLSTQLALAAYRLSPTDPAARARLLAAQVQPIEVASADTHDGPVHGLAFSPSHQLVASAGDDGLVRLWDVSNPNAITQVGPALSGQRGAVASVEFNQDGTMLVSVGTDGTLRLWDIRDPRRSSLAGVFDNGTAITAAAFLPDGRTLAAGGVDGTLTFLDITAPQAIRRRGAVIGAHPAGIKAMALAPDAPLLATAGDDGAVRMWAVDDPDQPHPVGLPLDSGGAVQAVAFGPNGRLVAGTADGLLLFWDVRDQDRPRNVDRKQTRPVPISNLQFWLDGRALVVTDAGGTPREWNTSRLDRVSPVVLELVSSETIQSFVVVSNTMAISAGTDGKIRTWSQAGARLPIVFASSLTALDVDRAGKTLVGGFRDGQVAVWDIGVPLLSSMLSEVRAGPPDRHGTEVALRPDGALLAAADAEEVHLWNLTDRVRPAPAGALPGTGPIAFAPKGDRLLTGVGHRSLQLWDIADPAVPRPLGGPLSTGHDRDIELATLAPERPLLAAADNDSRIHLWDIADPSKPAASLDLHGAKARALIFAPDGKTLFSADDTGMIRSWDVTDPAQARELDAVRAHTAAIRTLTIDQSGHRLASGGADQTARLWDIAEPSAIRPLGDPIEAKIGWTWFLRFDPADESRLLGVGDQLSTLWYTDPAAVAEKLCSSSAAMLDEQQWRSLLPSVPYTRAC
ncbi:WD40 repeat domain-containing protein [Nocardia sp. NBC_01499]|uniref:WD40 repeat domain-containing protein n=1 Tax=Nocardia sp. NBC_01499 TaxID=2903597 RepID=UPI003863A0DD